MSQQQSFSTSGVPVTMNVSAGPGIDVYTDPMFPGEVFVSLENGCEDSTATVNAAVSNITCLDLGATPGTYTFETRVAAYATEIATPTNHLSASYVISGGVRTTGAAATIVGTPDKMTFEEGALSAGNCQVSVSGNNLIIVCTGTLGYNINWHELTSATFVG